MKKLLILLILLFALPAYAQQCSEESPCPELARLSPAMMGSVPVAAPVGITVVAKDDTITEINWSASISGAYTTTSGSNKCLIVIIAGYWETTGSAWDTGIAFGATSGTRIAYIAASSEYGAEIWAIKLGAHVGATANITGTYSDRISGSVSVLELDGVAQTTPGGNPVSTGSHEAANLSLTVPSPASTSLIVDGWGTSLDAGTGTLGANQIVISNYVYLTNQGYASSSYQLGSDGGAMTWTKTNCYQGGVACEIYVAP